MDRGPVGVCAEASGCEVRECGPRSMRFASLNASYISCCGGGATATGLRGAIDAFRFAQRILHFMSWWEMEPVGCGKRSAPHRSRFGSLR